MIHLLHHVRFKSKNSVELVSKNFYLGLNRGANKLVTPGVLQPTPLKKNLAPRFEARTRRGTSDYISEIRDYTKDYMTSNSKPHGELGIPG